MSDHPFIIVWRILRDEFKAAFPSYKVTMREPTTTEAAQVKTIWIAAPDLGIENEGRNNAPEVPLTVPVVINVVYSPSLTVGDNTGEGHYEQVLLSRLKEQRVLERVGVKASSYGIRGWSDGGTVVITEKQVISALIFNLSFMEPAEEE